MNLVKSHVCLMYQLPGSPHHDKIKIVRVQVFTQGLKQKYEMKVLTHDCFTFSTDLYSQVLLSNQ